MISILDAFVLRLEKEEELFLQMNDVLHQKLKDIKSKYQIGLSIEKFLKEISKFEDPTERENAIKEFRERPIFNKTKKMGDFFNVDLDSSDENKIAYEIKISKNLEYMLPDNAVSALYQATDAVNSLGEKAIVSAIQYFEEFFTCILRKLIVEKPNLYFGKKTIEYQELMKYDNIETIKQKFIDTEVNNVTNVCGILQVDENVYSYRFIAEMLTYQHSKMKFDYQSKAHPSVISSLYSLPCLPISEQNSYCRLFIALDKKMQIEQCCLNKLKEQKKYLLSKMFI